MGLARHLLWAAVLRAVLQLLDASNWVDLFPGSTTPVTDYQQVKEGLWLQSNGYSPYHNPLVHTQPITLLLLGAVSSLPYLAEAFAIIADLCSCTLINRIAGGSWSQPSSCSLLYLWSPFTILPCVSTALSTFSCPWVLLAVSAATRQRSHLAAWSLALATYMDLHPLLLTVPLMLLLKNGMENLSPNIGIISTAPSPRTQRLQDSSPPADPQPASNSDEASPLQPSSLPAEPSQPLPQEPDSASNQGSVSWKRANPKADGSMRECYVFGFAYVAWLLALLVMSDLRLRHFPENCCVAPWLRHWEEWMEGRVVGLVPPGLADCWLWRSYGDIINVIDLTPNIGLFWYFFLEIFTAFQGFFRLVFHSQVLALVVPLAIRFSHRPLLLLVVFLLYLATFKPYPSLSDLALYQSFLPLLHAQLRISKVALYMAVLFAVLVVLIPAMWWQWLVVESANANFFYSVTLLLGAFHVLLQAHILNCSVKLDRLIAGKHVPGLSATASKAL